MNSSHALWAEVLTRVAGLTFKDWAVATAYVVGDLVQPTTPNGYFFQIDTGDDGTSHAATEPTWPTTIGGTVADNTATWTCRGVGLMVALSEDTTLKASVRARMTALIAKGLTDSVITSADENEIVDALKQSLATARG